VGRVTTRCGRLSSTACWAALVATLSERSGCGNVRSPLHQEVCVGLRRNDETVPGVQRSRTVLKKDAKRHDLLKMFCSSKLSLQECRAKPPPLELRENLEFDEKDLVGGVLQTEGADRLAVVLNHAEFGIGETGLKPAVLGMLIPGPELADHNFTVGPVVKVSKEGGVRRRCGSHVHLVARPTYRR
jgi:hypothetical protein